MFSSRDELHRVIDNLIILMKFSDVCIEMFIMLTHKYIADENHS